jgi:voltage-gated potassium channel
MSDTRWRQLTEWPLAAVSVVFLAAYSWEVVADLEGPAATVAEIVQNVSWVVFVVDYLVRLVLARLRWSWVWRHIPDLAIVALPMLRPLRLLRLVTLVSILNRTAGRFFRGRVIIYAAGGLVLLTWIAAVAELDAERQAGHIRNIGDALWWAFVTVTTVGYGDYAPVTLVGRLVAVGVMIGGIALIGVVTATLASWIVERVQVEAANERDELRQLRDEIAELRTVLQDHRTNAAPTADG